MHRGPDGQDHPAETEAGTPRPADTGDIRRVLESADPMERCWLLLAGLQGLRCKEIAGLRREDVIDAKGLLRILGKGDRERVLPLHPDVLAGLRALPMPRTGYIFVRPRGGGYDRELAECMLQPVPPRS